MPKYSKSVIVLQEIPAYLCLCILQWFSLIYLILAEYTFRLQVEEGVGIPNIPVHPIGYNDAEILLRYSHLVGDVRVLPYIVHFLLYKSVMLKLTYIKISPEVGTLFV